MKTTLKLMVLFLLFHSCLFAQKQIIFRSEVKEIVFDTIKDGTGNLPVSTLKKIYLTKGLTFDVSALQNATIAFYANGNKEKDISTDQKMFNQNLITSKRYQYIGDDAAIKSLTLTIKIDGKDKNFDDIGKEGVAPIKKDPAKITDNSPPATYTDWNDYLSKSNNPKALIIKQGKRYFPSQDKAYICLDPYGNIIGRKPVNLDQDDEIIFLVIVPIAIAHEYSVNDNNAEYAPTDLNFRPIDEITTKALSGGLDAPTNYTIKEFIKGPYTSSNVTFDIKRNSVVANTFTIHINPLYHVALGVSYVSSYLESPDFTVAPSAANPAVNTINTINGGNRAFITFNVIWYWWNTLKYVQGDPLTRGRDVLKEPNFITRFNPTFGVALKDNLKDNFFLGMSFEFARGGSISAGWHYGKIKRLADRNFVLGDSAFTGTAAEIQTEEVYKWGKFVSITLDTRIFNRLFNRSVTGN